MAQGTFHFPRGFLWGTATAAHQVEGGNSNNNWWAWEQRPGRIAEGHKSGLACNWWGGRWREDLDRAAAAGHNAIRFSVEWSRIQPAADRWDEASLDRYREMLRGMQERGLTPMVTLHHYTDPLWLSEKGGWTNPEVVTAFEKFTRKVVEACREYVTYWITINEPNVLAVSAYMLGEFPPGVTYDLKTTVHVYQNQVLAHAAAYRAIHELQGDAQVSLALNVRPFHPSKSWSPLDGLVSGLLNSAFNDFFPRALTTGEMRLSAWRKAAPEAKETLDFLGINIYNREWVRFTPRLSKAFIHRHYPPDCDASDSGMFLNDPEGMHQILHWAKDWGLPIIITEHGIENVEDSLRRRTIIENLHQVWRHANENVPVRGYFHWTLVDNFEWDHGWTQRFGLWELDVETQARRKRPSADLYGEICRENGISSDMVGRYTPELLEKIFPG